MNPYVAVPLVAGVFAFGLAAVFMLDRRVGRRVRIWRAEARRRARRGYVR